MPRYTTRPSRTRACDDDWPDETKDIEVYDSGSWSEDQPTGLFDATGEMIWRCGRSIGFLAEG